MEAGTSKASKVSTWDVDDGACAVACGERCESHQLCAACGGLYVYVFILVTYMYVCGCGCVCGWVCIYMFIDR